MPTLDRIFLGLVAGGVTAALIATVLAVVFGVSIFDALGTFVLASLLALLLMLLLQAPVWAGLQSLGVPGFLASTLAGAFALSAGQLVGTALIERQLSVENLLSAEVIFGVVIGAVSGFACWRVAARRAD